jgi:hypothetical protein
MNSSSEASGLSGSVDSPDRSSSGSQTLGFVSHMPSTSIDITFSSNGMSNLSQEAVNETLRRIVAITRCSLLYLGNRASSELVANYVGNGQEAFALTDERTPGRHSHKVSGVGVRGVAGLTACTLARAYLQLKVHNCKRRRSSTK